MKYPKFPKFQKNKQKKRKGFRILFRFLTLQGNLIGLSK